MSRGLSFFLGPRPGRVIGLLIFLGTLAVYFSVSRNEFTNFDDPTYITNNPRVFHGLSLASVKWAFTTGHGSNWHPLTWLSLMVDCQFFGDHAGWHHLENVVWHAMNALLLFGLLREATGSLWRSALVTAFFALHPLHVESVAWASERKDVLSAFFGLLALWAYVRYARKSQAGNSQGRKFYWLALACFILGLLCKPMLVTLPFIMLLLDFWPLQRTGSSTEIFHFPFWMERVREKIPFFFLAVAASLATFYAQQTGGAVVKLELVPFSIRLANAMLACIIYLRKMFCPVDLAVFYPYPRYIVITHVLLASAVVLAITLRAVLWRRQFPYLLMGWLWYLGMLVPVIGLVQVGSQCLADRYTYLPLIGVFIMLAWGGADIAARWRWTAPILALLSMLALWECLVLTRRQVGFWRNSTALFRHTLDLGFESPLACHNLGHALSLREGNQKAAIPYYRRALFLRPNFPTAEYNLANSLNLTGNLPDALEHYRQALRLKPDYEQAHYGLANSLALQGRYLEAHEHFVKALRFKPDYAEAHVKFANLLVLEGRAEEAEEHYRAGLRLMPESQEGHFCLAGVLARQKKFKAAVEQYVAALKLKPNDPSALNDLAWILAAEDAPEVHDATRAAALSLKACQLTRWRDPGYIDTLAAAYSECGRFASAVEAAGKAVEVARASGLAGLAEKIQSNVKFYEQGTPCRKIIQSR